MTDLVSPCVDEPAVLQQQRRGAEAGERLQLVADEQDGPAAAGHVVHLAQALLLEGHVADRQHLVHDQDLRVEVGRHAKASRTYMPLE